MQEAQTRVYCARVDARYVTRVAPIKNVDASKSKSVDFKLLGFIQIHVHDALFLRSHFDTTTSSLSLLQYAPETYEAAT